MEKLLALIGAGSKLASILQGVDVSKYETQLASIAADGEKLASDMGALEQQIVADAKAAGA